jgi:hypothetical protein
VNGKRNLYALLFSTLFPAITLGRGTPFGGDHQESAHKASFDERIWISKETRCISVLNYDQLSFRIEK